MTGQDDWRLTKQQDYLFALTLRQRRWQPDGPNGDHAHCAFCWAKFADLGLPDEIQVGFATLDDAHWVCAACVEDFKGRFQWVLRYDPALQPP